MRWLPNVSWITLVVGAGLGMVCLDATSIARLPPTPSKRSRANDTPPRDHLPGGGPDGGSVHSIAVANSQPTTVFASFRGGGVYKSADRGASWLPAERGLPANEWCDLVADPIEGATLYASCFDGLFKTTDGGALWRQLDIDNPRPPIISAADPRVVYQPPLGGLVRSRDGGQHWSSVASARRVPNSCSFAVDPTNSSTLYCAGEGGLAVSRNGGARWRKLPAAPEIADISALALAPSGGNKMFAATDDGGFVTTMTGGTTWLRLGDAPDRMRLDDLHVAEPTGTIIYARQHDRVVRTDDGGRNWNVLPVAWPVFTFHTYAVDPQTPDDVYVGAASGLFASSDGGRTWTLRRGGITRASTSVVLHEAARATLFVSTGHALFTSDDDGTHWSVFQPPAHMKNVDPRSLASDGNGGVLLRAGTDAFRLERDAVEWERDIVPGGATEGLRERLSTGQRDLRTLVGSDRFFYASDGGTSWRPAQIASAKTVTGLVSAGRDRRVLVAAVGGIQAVIQKEANGLWRSVDDGATWVRVPFRQMNIIAHCCRLIVDPLDESTIYAIVYGETIGGGGAAVARSTDAGATWSEIVSLDGALVATPTMLIGQLFGRGLVRSTNQGRDWTDSGSGLPAEVTVTGVAYDPRRPTILVAATDGRGVYRSVDAGVTWHPTGRTLDSSR